MSLHDAAPAQGSVLTVRGLGKTFPAPGGGTVTALRGLSFSIEAGRSLAIVGESGSGKTTAALCVARLLAPDTGQIELGGEDFLRAAPARARAMRRQFGLVQQNPLTSLDPRVRVWASVAEPLLVHEPALGRAATRERAMAWLDRVGLGPAQAQSLPHQLSGGQLQRAVIARALILQPRLVILDEPTSALDVSIQAQMLNLLCDLRDEFGLSYLFITHNLSLVELLAGEVLVMRSGEVVERGAVHQVFGAPAHEYTRELIAAIPGNEAPGAGAAMAASFPHAPAMAGAAPPLPVSP